MADDLDLYAQNNLNPDGTSADSLDLYKQHGIDPNMKPQSSLDKFVNSGLGQEIIGAGDAARGTIDSIVNLPAQALNLALPQNMQLQLLKGGDSPGYNAGHMAGDVAGFLGGGEVLDSARQAAEAAPMVGKLAQALGGDGLSGVARRAAGSGLYGAIQSPNDQGKGAGEMAALSVALDALFGGAAKALPSNWLKGNLSNEELAKNLEASRGTNTPIGDVTGSPGAKQWYENLVEKIPGSGSDATSAATANQIKDIGQSLVNKYLGDNNPAEVSDKLLKSLQDAFYKHNAEKNSFYSDAYDHANKIGFKLELPAFKNAVDKYKNIIDDQDFLKFEPQSKQLLSALSNYGQATKNQYEPQSLIDQIEGKLPERIYPDLKEANIFAGSLNGLSKNANASPLPADRNMANVYRELGSSLKTDIKSSIEKSGNDDLMNMWQEAEKNYANNFSPFLDKDIYKFINGNKQNNTDDLVSSFIKTGKNTDKSQQLDKLVSKLDLEGQDLLKYSYLSRAMTGPEDARYIDPNKLRNLWGDQNLGQAQKQVLFPDKNDRQALDMYSRLVNMNSDALSRMANPNTGQKAIPAVIASKAIPEISKIISGLGAGGGAAVGGIPGAIFGSLVAPLGVAAGSRVLNKYATSPDFREKMIKALIEGSPNTARLRTASQILKPVLGYGFNQ